MPDLQLVKGEDYKLNARENRFRYLAESMPQLVWTARPTGTVKYTNSRITDYDGARQKADGSWSWIRMIHKDDLPGTIHAWSQAAKQGFIYQVEHRIRMKDGSFRWHLTRACPVDLYEGTVWYGTTTDIHDLKMTTEALRQSEERFRTIADFTCDWEMWQDLSNNILYCSPACEKLTGYRPEDFIARPELCRQIIHSCDLPVFDRHVQTSLHESQCEGEAEWRIIRPDGSVRWISHACRPVHNTQGEYSGVRISNRDITDRKKSETALKRSEIELAILNRELEDRVKERTTNLRESEKKYRSLFETKQDAILMFDSETRRFIDVNNSALTLYGYTRTEFMKLTHFDITDEPEMAKQKIPATVAGKLAAPFRSAHRKKTGEVFPVEISASSFPIKEHSIICATVRDISDQVGREKEIETTHRELRRLTVEITLAQQHERARIAEELHDGVSQLLGSAHLRLSMFNRHSLSGSTRKMVDKVDDIIQQTLQTIRTMTFELSCPMLNELGLVAALKELCFDLSDTYSIQFEFKGDCPALPLPMCQKIALYRSTRELMMNVVKHAGAKHAHVKLKYTDGTVHIYVRDDGRGFDTAHAGKKFSPSGGFGLFSLGEYIQSVGGNFDIESVPGDGTEVHIAVSAEGQEHE
jgi:PAS domain S-box-containing protein